MRASTLVFVLVLAAALAAPLYANGYGTSNPPAAPSAGTTATPAPEAVPEQTTAPVETTTPATTEPVPMGTTSPEATTAPATTTTTTTGAMTTSQMDSLAASTVARCYAIDPATVAQLQSKGYTSSDIAVLGNLSARTGRPVSEFVQLHDQGMGWSDIASRYNVAMSDLMTPMAMMVSPEVDAYNRQFARQYFGLKDQDITALRNQGMSWGEIYMAANLAARTNQPITQIASLHSQGLGWTEIGARYNVASADISRPFVPAGQVAGVTAQVSPMAPMSIIGPEGQIILTQRESERFRAMGYDWRSIAIAANISMRTGDSVEDILRMTDRGMTWPQIARTYGLDPKDVINVNSYPFRRDQPLMQSSTMQQQGVMVQPQNGMAQPLPGSMQQSPGTGNVY